MIIERDKKSHAYSVNGDVANISITELLAKHGIAPDYSAVPKGKLEDSAARGREIHEDLEFVLSKAKYEPKTEQGKMFKKWCKDNKVVAAPEQMLAIKWGDLVVAGTTDIIGFKSNKRFVADQKTTSVVHREYVSWQTSLADYFARKLGKEPVNGKVLNWLGAEEVFCLHYEKDKPLREAQLDLISDIEIERLLNAELKGDFYQRPALVLHPDVAATVEDAEIKVWALKKQLKEAEEIATRFREGLKKAFEEQGIRKWTSPTELVTVTYVDAVDSFTVDGTKLRQAYPEIYRQFAKPKTTAAHIRIKIKKEGEDDGND